MKDFLHISFVEIDEELPDILKRLHIPQYKVREKTVRVKDKFTSVYCIGYNENFKKLGESNKILIERINFPAIISVFTNSTDFISCRFLEFFYDGGVERLNCESGISSHISTKFRLEGKHNVK